MIQYVRSPDSAVHVVNQAGDGEFTFCDRDITQADSRGLYWDIQPRACHVSGLQRGRG